MFNLRYPGQYYDAETDSNYNVFRTYESATGRYLQSDPIGLGGGISMYASVGNNPLSYTDPSGKIFGADDAAIGTVILGGVVVGGTAAFVGTLIGGGNVHDAFAAVPGGAVGGALFVALAGVEAVTAVGAVAATVLDVGANAAMDAWTVSDVTGPMPAPRKKSCP